MSIINGSQPLTVVTKNFISDATGVLDPCETLNQALNRLKISLMQKVYNLVQLLVK